MTIAIERSESMERARAKVKEADLAIEHAVGALDMAAQSGGSDLLGGYSGASAQRYLRDARRLVAKAKAVLDVLPS